MELILQQKFMKYFSSLWYNILLILNMNLELNEGVNWYDIISNNSELYQKWVDIILVLWFTFKSLRVLKIL